MKLNRKSTVTKAPVYTHGGAKASHINAVKQLRRSVLATMLWEDSFYEDGQEIADRISSLVAQVPAQVAADLAVEVRTKGKLRHVPLKVVREMARVETHKPLVAETLARIIQRPDELSEFVSIYWKEKKQPLSNQVKKGLAKAFTKFDEYSLSKYNRDNAIKLRDVLFLCHAKPKDGEQEKLWKKLVGGYCSKCWKKESEHKSLRHPFVEAKLETADTWEVALSATKGQNKKEAWADLVKREKLGALALLRNLRNMTEEGVSDTLIRQALKDCNPERVLPFRFITAAKHAPKFEPELEQVMFKCLANRPKLTGKTVLVVDVSGSMGAPLSSKSENNRLDTAAALAMLVRELSDNVSIYATAGSDGARQHKTELVPARRGFALRDEIKRKAQTLGGGGIFLKQVMDYVAAHEDDVDRVIVISDSQDCDLVNKPDSAQAVGKKNYLMDISSEKNGIAYNKFTVINGFSEAVIDYIQASEDLDN
jgi:60 kDa SS-A/Ro ribonucleoprotein